MSSLKPILLTVFPFLLLILCAHAQAQEGGISGRDEPSTLEDMEGFSTIAFKPENFEKVANGMGEKDVHSLLGRPLDMKKQRRQGNQWAFQYYYPDGYVVNFRKFQVVGKEKR